MSTSSRQSLTSLLPASYPIPPRLLTTTDLLVTLSLQRAPNLKPDEEIARTHACADLACQRLRVLLRLPNLKSSTAPCRPAVYKKLLTFLTEKLADVDVSGTPKRKRTEPALAPARDDASTPTKRRKTQDLQPVAGRRTQKRSGFVGRVLAASETSDGTSELKFMLAPVRKLCKKFDVPELVPHAYIGVSVLASILRPDMPKKVDQEMLHLTIAVFLLTLTRMRRGAMTAEVFDEVCQGSIEVLGGENQSVQDLIERINDEELTIDGVGGEWWDDLPLDVLNIFGAEETGDNHADEDQLISLRERLAKEDPEGVLLVGLGTMMNENVDFLSEAKLEEYDRWKAEVMREIKPVA